MSYEVGDKVRLLSKKEFIKNERPLKIVATYDYGPKGWAVEQGLYRFRVFEDDIEPWEKEK